VYIALGMQWHWLTPPWSVYVQEFVVVAQHTDPVGFYNRPVVGCLTHGPKSNLIDYALNRCVLLRTG